MSRIPSQGRLLSSHSQNSVLFANNDDQYEFDSSPSILSPSQHVIFNQSFYKQKQLINQQQRNQQQGSKQVQTSLSRKQHFLSLEYVKKYFQSHSIEPIVSKTMKAILDTDYLPENPYNILYRLLMPDTLLINSLHFYSKPSLRQETPKKINSNIKSLLMENKNNSSKPSNPADVQPWMEQILTKRIQIAEKEFFSGAKIARYVHPNALYIVWTQVGSRARLSTINQLITKHNLTSCFLSIGGPALLLLEGASTYSENNDTLKLSLKVNEPLAMSTFTGEVMLSIGYYIKVPGQEPSLILTNFCNFVIEQSLQQMQNNQHDTYLYLTKLSVGIEDKEAVVQWSTNQLVHQKAKIVKEIVKLLLTEKCQIKTHFYVKASKKMSATLFHEYFTLSKTYILISPTLESPQMNSTRRSTKSQASDTLSVYTSTPLSFVFEHFFTVPDYYECLDKAFGLNSIKNEAIFLEYRKEKYKQIVQDLKVHALANASWQLFFLSLYDTSLTPISYQNITEALNLVINSPLNFLSRTIHELKLCKIILHPTASSLTPNSQLHLYQTLQTICADLFQHQKQSDHPYPQIFVVFETLRKLLGVILTKQKFRVNVIRLLLDYAILCLRGVVNSFLTIGWSVSGTLHEYVAQLDKTLANDANKLLLSSLVTYEQYLCSFKALPSRSLYLPDEIKRYKQELGMTENQVRDLIHAKYLQNYQLYQNVYEFYWKLIQGKKLDYPLSRFMETVKIKAMTIENEIMEAELKRIRLKNQTNSKGQNKISLNRISSIEVYEMSKGINNELNFYAFSKDSLNESSLTQYKKHYQKFVSYFYDNIDNLISLSGKAKYIISLKTLPFLNQFSEESSGIYITTLYADLVIKKHLKKQEVFNIIYNELASFMESVDKDEIGVLGVYASWRNLGNASIVYHGDSDQIYTQTSFESTSFIKFDYKRKVPFDQFYKFLEHCVSAGKEIQVRLIYKDQKVIQSCNITFNLYFYQGHQPSLSILSNEKADQLLKPLIQVAGWEDRIFCASKEIVEWGVMNKVANKKNDQGKIPVQKSRPTSVEQLSPTKSMPRSSQNVSKSMRKILQEEQVSIEKLILEQPDGSSSTMKQHLTLSTLRMISPSYTNLQQSHHHLLTLLYLLTYIKHDRRNRFEFPFIMDQVALIQYYLMEHCLKSDKFIFLEALAVEIANLTGAIKTYLKQRDDNIGTEWELLWVEKLVCTIIGVVKMLMVNLTAQIKKYYFPQANKSQ